ncbi:MAG TPA: hypothetical protein VGB06_01710, partial [Solirubrobacterales bacterium]
DNPSVLVRLGGDGSIDQGFAASGFFSRPFTRISDVAVTPGGKVVLLARTIELVKGEWVESEGMAVRLRANGALDRSFGQGGRAELPLPKDGSVAAIAADSKGRVLLAGSLPQKPRKKARQSSHRSSPSGRDFLVLRLTATGEPDPGFGRNGRATTGFGKETSVLATDVLLDPAGRIVVGGKFSGPDADDAFAIVRFLGGGASQKSGKAGRKPGKPRGKRVRR